MKREDDFETRRRHLADLSEADLEQRFWELLDRTVSPLVDLARDFTTPAVERSVLLRMGFSSIEARGIVEQLVDHNLMGKGAGNVVLTLSRQLEREYREAGRELAEGRHWDIVMKLFGKGER